MLNSSVDYWNKKKIGPIFCPFIFPRGVCKKCIFLYTEVNLYGNFNGLNVFFPLFARISLFTEIPLLTGFTVHIFMWLIELSRVGLSLLSLKCANMSFFFSNRCYMFLRIVQPFHYSDHVVKWIKTEYGHFSINAFSTHGRNARPIFTHVNLLISTQELTLESAWINKSNKGKKFRGKQKSNKTHKEVQMIKEFYLKKKRKKQRNSKWKKGNSIEILGTQSNRSKYYMKIQ